MKRRYSRVHQILKNAGVIESSSENESADSDIIENTPVVSPENCPEQAAQSTHLKCDSQGIENYTNLTNKHGGNEANCGNAISTTITSEQVYEVGEISIEAPAFSPLTPKVIHHTKGTLNDIEPNLHNVYKEPFEVGETTIKASAISQLSPLQASQLVTAERIVEGSDFLSPPLENFYATENRTDYEQTSSLSSPVPDMSPATTKVFNMLIGTEIDSDDSIVDPNYVTDNSTTDDDSDACENSQRSKLNKPPVKNKRSNSPSILTEISGSLIAENEDIPVLVPSDNLEEATVNLKKRKIRDPNTWKINVEKRKRLKGEQYLTKKGKVIQARPLKPAKCLLLPKHKCISLVPEDERLKIYTKFRNLSSLQEQRYFVVNHVTKSKKKRETIQTPSRSEFTLSYSLTVANDKKIVCREFFLDTLNITGAFVKGAFKKMNPQGLLLPENRGKKAPPNKLMLSEEQFIHDHIQSFPAIESHYCRRDSSVRYLDPSLNITIMHREYQKLCATKSIKGVSFEKYRSIFKTYKLSFHKPKKDLCKQCLAFKEMNDDEKSKHQDTHTLHLARKSAARQCRDEDKEIAQSDDKTLSFNFDLEAVLNTPKGAAGPFFYVQRFKISSKKKQDLMKLCTDLQIPKTYHSFYANLPYSETTRDALPEPDAAEGSE
uniref:Uncharacterized protein n=1 Tax=Heliothis virescens TaxID=7102 RepID=A0A2A4JVA0_HELVI